MYDKLFDIIAIEGIDGTGKTTLRDRLKAINDVFHYQFTEEPRKRPPYRKMLLEHGSDLDPLTQMALVTADRYEHIREYWNLRYLNEIIFDRLITDRYNDSTWVYQVVLGGVSPELFHRFEKVFEIQQPDLVILLDIDPKLAMDRTNRRSGESNHFDTLALDKHEKMRKGYLDRAFAGIAQGKKYLIVDARMEMDKIVKMVDVYLKPYITALPPVQFLSDDEVYSKEMAILFQEKANESNQQT